MSVRVFASSRPDLRAFYHHASTFVLGWPVNVMFSPVHWDIRGQYSGVNLIGCTANGWNWQTVSDGVDLYRLIDSGEQERLPFFRAQEVAHV